MINPIIISNAILLAVLMLGLGLILWDLKILKTVKDFWYLYILNFILKFPFSKHFWGLEYEDSYIWTVFPRLLLYYQDFSFSRFYTYGCVLGSLNDCVFVGTYSGHLSAFPFGIFWVFKTLGYSPNTIIYTNFIITFLILFLLINVAKSIKNDTWLVVFVVLIYCISPAINLFQTTGLVETFSSFFLFITFSSYLIFVNVENNINRNENKARLLLLFSFLALIYTLLIKRENIVILVLPLASIIFDFKNLRFKKSIIIYLFFTILLSVAFYFLLLQSTVETESQEISSAAFDLKYLISIFPIFVKSFLRFNYFIVTGVLLIIGILIIPFDKSGFKVLKYPLLILLCFLFLYSIHYRSYYFIKSQVISEFESLRYINNFYPFISLISGYTLYRLFFITEKRILYSKQIKLSTVVVLIVLSIVFSRMLRVNFSNEEFQSRFLPIIETTGIIHEHDLVISDTPMAFQMLNSKDFKILDFTSIDIMTTLQYLQDQTDGDIYYLERDYHDNEIFQKRYESFFENFDKLFTTEKVIFEKEKHKLILLKLKTNQ